MEMENENAGCGLEIGECRMENGERIIHMEGKWKDRLELILKGLGFRVCRILKYLRIT